MQILISEDRIRTRVEELGAQLSGEFAGESLTIVGVLTGSLLFLADLIRRITIPHRIDFVQASSYRGATTQAGDLRINENFFPDITDRHVLLVDDIFDTGKTLEKLREMLLTAKPASLKTAVLLWKTGTQTTTLKPDYHGFQIPEVFVVGYGLDYNQDFRHLPYLAELTDRDKMSM